MFMGLELTRGKQLPVEMLCWAELRLALTLDSTKDFHYCCCVRHVWIWYCCSYTERHTRWVPLRLFICCWWCFFAFDFHGFLDWSRSTKTDAHSRFVMAERKTETFTLFTVWLCCNHIRCQHLTRYRVIDVVDHRSALLASKIIRRLSLGCSLPKC